MTKEQKELLLKDLCARLYYGVKVRYSTYEGFITCTLLSINPTYNTVDLWSKIACFTSVSIHKIKPYLFPMSSMTEEQIDELKDLCDMYDPVNDNDAYEDWGMRLITKHFMNDGYHFKFNFQLFEFLNKNRLDYCGLIEKELAIDATGLDIY